MSSSVGKLGALSAVCALTAVAAVPGHGATYSVSGTQILKNGVAWEGRGVNKQDIWSVNPGETNSWGVDVLREPIDMKLTTLTRMQEIVDAARLQNKAVIFAAFWYDNNAIAGGTTPYPNCQLLGVNPSQDARWQAVLTRWRDIANKFKNQSDVWFDVWNEPYNWDRNNLKGYTDDLWLSDMTALVQNIRGTGANNILVVPGSLMGQGDGVVASKGPTLISGRSNIVFGLHCYQTEWGQSQANIESRFQNLLNKGLAVMVTEYGAGQTYAHILGSARQKRIGSLAWEWKRSDTEAQALLRNDGTPNDTNNTVYFGSGTKNFTLGARNGGTQLVSNGNFSSGTTNWLSWGSGSYTAVVNGTLQVGSPSSTGVYSGRYQGIAIQPKTVYTFRCKGRVGAAGQTLEVVVAGNNYNYPLKFTSTTMEEKVVSFVTRPDITWMQATAWTAPGSYGFVDDISVVR